MLIQLLTLERDPNAHLSVAGHKLLNSAKRLKKELTIIYLFIRTICMQHVTHVMAT